MRIKLLRDSRVTVKAGEAVEVSPEEACFLIGVGSAVKEEEPKKPTKEEPKKPAKKKK